MSKEPRRPRGEEPRILLVATDRNVLRVDAHAGRVEPTEALEGPKPTALAQGPDGDVWCGTEEGVYRATGVAQGPGPRVRWGPAGLGGVHVTALAVGPGPAHTLWAGTEPSGLWKRAISGADHPGDWSRTAELNKLSSSSEWAFPPRPDTHHVRWIACHPMDPERLWLAIEAGALVSTRDGGRSWRDRVPGGPRDTHELAVDPGRPETLHSAAGDGYFRSEDGGSSWSRPGDGLEIGYFRSVAIDPGEAGTVLMSGASRPRTAYVARHADGRLYRRENDRARWVRVTDGWPDPPATIAPLLRVGSRPGELWAADERGVHRTDDGGLRWTRVAEFDPTPNHLRALLVCRPAV